MTNHDVVRAAFQDELSKIAGELQGFTRIGRKPIGIERLLEREVEEPIPPSQVFAVDAEKVSAAQEAAASLAKYKVPAALGAGLVGGHVVAQANRDRKVGRQMRLQGQSY
jgi:hypothetical protein